eukprot:7311424-Karenia_brevis.AAC.1
MVQRPTAHAFIDGATGRWNDDEQCHEIDHLLKDTWLPIFQKYATRSEPDWTHFLDRFGAYVKQFPLEVQSITGAELRALV